MAQWQILQLRELARAFRDLVLQLNVLHLILVVEGSLTTAPRVVLEPVFGSLFATSLVPGVLALRVRRVELWGALVTALAGLEVRATGPILAFEAATAIICV